MRTASPVHAFPGVVVCLAGVVLGWTGQARAQLPDPGSSVSVRTVRPTPAESPGFKSNLYVEQDVKVAARTSGVIHKVFAERGQAVRAGETLAEVETEVATRALDVARQQQRLATAELDRITPLAKDGVVSPQDLERAQIQHDAAAAAVAHAQAELDLCRLKAPFDGVVVERWAIVGMRVYDDDNTPLFRIAARGPLRARIDLPESQLGTVTVGTAAAVVPETGGPAYPARVVFIAPAIDATSGTAPVIVQLEGRSAANLPRPGASVDVRFPSAAASNESVRLPRAALGVQVPAPGAEVRVLVVADGRVGSKAARVIRTDGDDVLLSGIGAADQVIVPSGPMAVGTPVRVEEARR